MEAVALHVVADHGARQGHELGDGRLAAMEAGVEAGHLRHVGQPLGHRVDGGQVVRLMERGERRQLAQLVEDLRRHDRRPGEVRAAVDDAMPDAEHAGAAVALAQPRGQRVERGAPVAHARVELGVDQALARVALDGEPRRRADAVDLPARFEAPRVAVRPPPVDAELEARGAGVEDEGEVVHHAAPDAARTPVAARAWRRAWAAMHGDRAARDLRPHGVGAAGQDDGHAGAEHEAGAVGVGEEAELLGQHVAGLEVRREQDVRIAGHLRLDALHPGGLLADRVVEGQRPVEQAALDLAAVGHLAQARRVDRRRHLGRDRLDGGENRDLRPLHVERDREVDRVLADVGLVFQRRRDVDRRVGHDQDLVIGRHVHDEDVADAPADAQAGLLRHDRAQQLVGVQAAFHQQLGLAGADQRHRLRGRRMAVRGIHDPDLAEVDAVLGGERLDGGRRADEDRRDQSLRARLDCRRERRVLARVRDRRRHGLKASTPLQQRLVLARPCLCRSCCLCHGPSLAAPGWRGEPRCPFLSVTE